MATASKPRLRTLVLAVMAATALGSTSPAMAQYYHVPDPDYYHNDTLGGTFGGGALGAITGAIIGGKGNRGEGALIGAGVGAIAGNVLGRAKDNADYNRAATGAAIAAQANQQAAARAVTNFELAQMTQAGLSDDVIISTIRSNGARLDLSPQGLIALRNGGVSDRVVVAAQQMTNQGAFTPPPAVVAGPPVYVAPAPVRVYHYHPHCYPRYWHHGPHAHLHFRF